MNGNTILPSDSHNVSAITSFERWSDRPFVLRLDLGSKFDWTTVSIDLWDSVYYNIKDNTFSI